VAARGLQPKAIVNQYSNNPSLPRTRQQDTTNSLVRSNAPLSFVVVICGVVTTLQFLPVHHRIPTEERIARSSALCTSCSFERTSIVRTYLHCSNVPPLFERTRLIRSVRRRTTNKRCCVLLSSWQRGRRLLPCGAAISKSIEIGAAAAVVTRGRFQSFHCSERRVSQREAAAAAAAAAVDHNGKLLLC
jgi:hypothetical protein